jgi:hypothetical protein
VLVFDGDDRVRVRVGHFGIDEDPNTAHLDLMLAFGRLIGELNLNVEASAESAGGAQADGGSAGELERTPQDLDGLVGNFDCHTLITL